MRRKGASGGQGAGRYGARAGRERHGCDNVGELSRHCRCASGAGRLRGDGGMRHGARVELHLGAKGAVYHIPTPAAPPWKWWKTASTMLPGAPWAWEVLLRAHRRLHGRCCFDTGWVRWLGKGKMLGGRRLRDSGHVDTGALAAGERTDTGLWALSRGLPLGRRAGPLALEEEGEAVTVGAGRAAAAGVPSVPVAVGWLSRRSSQGSDRAIFGRFGCGGGKLKGRPVAQAVPFGLVERR